MQDIIFYQHAGSGNHGCEALVRTLTPLLRQAAPGTKITLASLAPREDRAYGLDQVVERIVSHSVSFQRLHRNWCLLQLSKLFPLHHTIEAIRTDLPWLQDCQDKLYVAIGGDNYCYGGGKAFYCYDRKITNAHGKRLLLGCSIEPEALRGELLSILQGFELITARESLTYAALKKVKGLKRLALVPDSAFLLPAEACSLPNGFEPGNTIGINLSPLILGYESIGNRTWDNYHALLDHIIRHTTYRIALIPHVVWPSNDDRLILQRLYDAFAHTGRLVRVADGNCCQLKSIIGHCSLFIGARTHATIAAYSQGVPTLVVGYSVKARGIAQDLFGDSQPYVLPVQSLHSPHDLTDAFCWLTQHQTEIHEHLRTIMTSYQARIAGLPQLIRDCLA